MAGQFIGLHMLVTLKEPVGMQLKGTVSDIAIVDPATGQRGIILSNGMSGSPSHKTRYFYLKAPY